MATICSWKELYGLLLKIKILRLNLVEGVKMKASAMLNNEKPAFSVDPQMADYSQEPLVLLKKAKASAFVKEKGLPGKALRIHKPKA